MSSNELVLRRPFLPRVPGLRHWLASAVLATTACLYLVAGLSVAWLEPASATPNARLAEQAPGAFRAWASRPSPSRCNSSRSPRRTRWRSMPQVPVSTLPNPAARPFAIAFATPADRLRAVECLTAAVYYEAAVESDSGPAAPSPRWC